MDSSSCLEYTNLDQKTTRQIKRMEVRKTKILKQDKQKIFTPQTRTEKLFAEPGVLTKTRKTLGHKDGTCQHLRGKQKKLEYHFIFFSNHKFYS